MFTRLNEFLPKLAEANDEIDTQREGCVSQLNIENTTDNENEKAIELDIALVPAENKLFQQLVETDDTFNGSEGESGESEKGETVNNKKELVTELMEDQAKK